jgi:hypothetical protein
MKRYTEGLDLQGKITPRRIQSCARKSFTVRWALYSPPASG